MAVYKVVDTEQLEADLTSVANSIRTKGGTTEELSFPNGFTSAILNISGEGSTVVAKEEQTKTLDVVENGTHTITPDDGKVLSSATVNVNVPIPDGYIQPSGELAISENGTYDVTNYASAVVEVVGDGGSGEAFPSNAVFKVTEYDNDGYPLKISMGIEGDTATTTYSFAYNWNYMSPYWKRITDVTLPSTITTISSGAFNGLMALENINGVNFDNITSIQNKAFENTSVEYDHLPPQLTTIESYSFARTGVCFTELPEGVTDIKDYAFQYCSSYNLTKLPSNLVNIGIGAFFGNNYNTLTFDEIPASVQTIGNNAFRGNCGLITVLKFRGTPTSISSSAFSLGTSITDIYVPWAEGAVANAPWSATNATIHYNTTFDENGDPIV